MRTMWQFSQLILPPALPAAHHIMEACARGMATANTLGKLVTVDYTAAGLANATWLPIVSRLRGLVIDVACPAAPVKVWPTPLIADLLVDSVIPDHPKPYVQEKLDGVLIARFEWNGAWRWIGRQGLEPGLEQIASHWWHQAGVHDDVVASENVLYFELCDSNLPTPTNAADSGLYLLDVIDRRDGSARELPDVYAMAAAAGLRTPRTVEWPGSLRPFAEELREASPDVEGFIFRWGHQTRRRLVNPKYTLLWNLLSTRSMGALADLWLAHEDLKPFLDWIPVDLHHSVRSAYAAMAQCISELAGADVFSPREAAALAMLAAVGGPTAALLDEGVDLG